MFISTLEFINIPLDKMNITPIIKFRIVIFTFELFNKDSKMFHAWLLGSHLLYLNSFERNLRIYGNSIKDTAWFNPFINTIKVISNKIKLQWPKAHQNIYIDNVLNTD